MRKLLSVMFLASAAAGPALAAPGDWSDRQQARDRRQQVRDQRDSRVDRSAVSRPERVERAPLVDRPQAIVEQRARTLEAPPHVEAVGRPAPRSFEAPRDYSRRQAVEPVRDWRSGQRPQAVAPALEQQRFSRDRIDQRMRQAQDRMAAARGPRTLPVSTIPQPGTQPPPPAVQRFTPPVQWNSSSWRHDNRYDWYNYRNRHRSLFHLSFYLDPFGWGYQPYSIGWRMWPSYYQSQYWLYDPWQYRLPYAPPGYRWVRYWDDAVLVDTWSGQVVDVIYDFFW